jgi:serine/threonine protein phosphatase PrpC
MRYHWAIETHVGRVRSVNEDAVAPANDGASGGPVVIAVADGMGGHVAGEVASRIAIESATADDATADVAPVLRVQRANDAVAEAMVENPRLAGMGTTLTLGLFEADGTLRLGHVGDSRAYLLRDGALTRLTTDHTVVAELVAGGYLTETEARSHPRRNLVTQSIGMRDVRIDEIDRQLEPGDRVLICSDGLTSMVDDAEVRDILDGNESPSSAAWALIDAANAAGGLDNTSVAVVDVTT